MTFRSDMQQGPRMDTSAGPVSQADLLAPLSQAEQVGLPISRTYRGAQRMPRLPAWYGELCERISWALAHGELDHDDAARLIDHAHPIALDQLGSSQRLHAAMLVGRGRNQRIVWPALDPRLDAEQAILADLAALVAGGHARPVPGGTT